MHSLCSHRLFWELCRVHLRQCSFQQVLRPWASTQERLQSSWVLLSPLLFSLTLAQQWVPLLHHILAHIKALPGMALTKSIRPTRKLMIKGGNATSLTRQVSEWLQKSRICLNTWSQATASFWAVVGLGQSDWRDNVTVGGCHSSPDQRAIHIGMPTTSQTVHSTTFDRRNDERRTAEQCCVRKSCINRDAETRH